MGMPKLTKKQQAIIDRERELNASKGRGKNSNSSNSYNDNRKVRINSRTSNVHKNTRADYYSYRYDPHTIEGSVENLFEREHERRFLGLIA